MMKLGVGILALLVVLGAATHSALATPSTEDWTPCIIDFQPPGMTHFGMDEYFTVGHKGPGNGGESFPTDLTLFEWGAHVGKKAQAEFGVDVLEPTDDPLFLNAKIGYPEGTLSPNAPALELQIFNVGTKRGATDYNIVNFITGKSLPNNQGRIHASYYIGNSAVLRSSSGANANTGYMVAYDRWLKKDKVQFAADYASGKNYIGGGGVGLYYYFTPNISILAGPVWFNDKGINGKMKWTTQLDMNF